MSLFSVFFLGTVLNIVYRFFWTVCKVLCAQCVCFWPDAILDLSGANLVTYFLWPVVCMKWTGNDHQYWNSKWLQPLVCFSRCTGGDYFILFFPLLRKAVQTRSTNRCRPSPSYGSLLLISAFCLAHLILIRSNCSRANESTQLPAPPKHYSVDFSSVAMTTNKQIRVVRTKVIASSHLPLPVCIPFRTCKVSARRLCALHVFCWGSRSARWRPTPEPRPVMHGGIRAPITSGISL